MDREYTLKNAFDNRYKNVMIFSLFFIFGLSLIATVDIMKESSNWVNAVLTIALTIFFSASITISRYRNYYHLSKHGTLIRNVKYTIIKDKGGIGLSVKYAIASGMKEFKYYRYPIAESEIGKTGVTDIIIDLKHPRYYYIFR